MTTQDNVVHLGAQPEDPKPASDLMNDNDRKRQAGAQDKWDRSGSVEDTLGEEYLHGRGIISAITPIPASFRFISDGKKTHALVAAITCPVTDELVAIQAIFVERAKRGVEKIERKCYGPARFGSVRLSAPGLKMQVTESVEDGLALMQMNGQPTLAVPGTNFLAKHFRPPMPCGIIVLGPDNDQAGRAALEKASGRLEGLGYVVRVLLPPPERDWCDVLPEFEERRAMMEEHTHG